jgi:hypothetical protein
VEAVVTFDVRSIEAAIDRYLRSRKIVLGGDGLGGQHFVIVRQAPHGTAGVATRCPLMVQVGEPCGFDHERVDLTDLAKAIADDLA